MGVAERIAKNTVFNFIATAMQLISGLVLSIVLARDLGTEQYGTYAFFSWMISLCGFAVNIGVGSMAQKYVAEASGRDNEQEISGVIRIAAIGRIIACVLVTLIIIAMSSQLTHIFHQNESFYFVIVGCIVLPQGLYLLAVAIYMGFQKFEYCALQELGSHVVFFIMAMILAALGFGVRALLSANLLSWILASVLGIFLVSRLTPLRKLLSGATLAKETKAKFLRFALASAGIVVVNYFLWQRFEVFFLGRYRSADEVGFYTLAWNLPSVAMALVPTVLANVLMPSISEQFGKGDLVKLRAIYIGSARYLMMLAFPIAVVFIALAAPIVNLLYGASYHPVIALMAIVTIPSAMYALTGACGAVTYGINEPGFIFKVGAVLAVLDVGINYLVIPRYGALGAAIGNSAVQVVYLPIMVWFVATKIKALWPIVDGLRTLLASSVAGISLFAIYHYLGTAPALALALPVGGGLYWIGIVLFGALRHEDIDLLQRAQVAVPAPLRSNYRVFMRMTARMVQARQSTW